MAKKDTTHLVLADDLVLHPDTLISNGNGIFASGNQGSGKSVILKLLLEQLAQKANCPILFFDKDEDVTSTSALFPRGFIATAGNCPTARDILADGLQCVFDLSTWPSMDAAGIMIARTVNALMREAECTPSHQRVPVVLGMDEASYWVPQNWGKSLDEDTYRLLRDAFESVAARGRKRGLVPFLFTQKFSTICKEVLSPGTYIMMRQNVHTEQQRYLDYILPVNEFKFTNDRQKKLAIGDLKPGQAIVRFADGDQRMVQFHHCKSEHKAHTPTTQAAISRYANVKFSRDAKYGAYIEDEEMEVSDEPITDQLPPQQNGTVQPRKRQAPRTHVLPTNSVVEPRVRAILSTNPDITDKDLAEEAKCSYAHAKLWRERIKAEQPVQIEHLQVEVPEQVTMLESRAPEQKARKVKKAVIAPAPMVTHQIYAALERDENLSPMELVARYGCDLETAKQARMSFFYGARQ